MKKITEMKAFSGFSKQYQGVGWRNRKFCWGDFSQGGWNLRSDFEHLNLKLQKIFCEYWTSIKTKISMTCIYKEYEIKTKMMQKQWLQLKMEFCGGYNMKISV